MGYEPNGYRVWCVEKEIFVTARDVVVDETNMVKSRAVVEDEMHLNNEDGESIQSNIDNEDVLNNNGKSDQADKQPSDMVEFENADPEMSGEKFYEKEDLESQINIRKSDRIKNKPKVSYQDLINNCVMHTQSLIYSIPNKFVEVKYSKDRTHWEKAIKEELDSHSLNKTWSIVQKPKNKNVVDCKWVFTIKQNEFGEPIKYKARLVARGFTQEY